MGMVEGCIYMFLFKHKTNKIDTDDDAKFRGGIGSGWVSK